MRRRDPTRVWSRSIGVLMAAALVMLAATPAFADVCVQANKEKDNLSASDREAVKVIVSDALESRGKTVVESNCDGTYRFYNVKLGSTIRATLVGPDGKKRQLETNSVDDLSKIYEQLVEALLTGKSAREVAGRDTVTSGQQNKERFTADDLGYLRLGYGTIVGANFVGGPSFGFGWRRELRNFALDFSIMNLIIPTTSNVDGLNGSFVRVGGEYLFDGDGASTPFVGGGISLGGTAVKNKDDAFGGFGAQAEVSAGYEMFRTSNLRLLIRGNAILPIYKSENAGKKEADQPKSLYTPSFTLSIIGAFGG